MAAAVGMADAAIAPAATSGPTPGIASAATPRSAPATPPPATAPATEPLLAPSSSSWISSSSSGGPTSEIASSGMPALRSSVTARRASSRLSNTAETTLFISIRATGPHRVRAPEDRRTVPSSFGTKQTPCRSRCPMDAASLQAIGYPSTRPFSTTSSTRMRSTRLEARDDASRFGKSWCMPSRHSGVGRPGLHARRTAAERSARSTTYDHDPA